MNCVDPNGHIPFFILTAIIGAVIGLGIVTAVDCFDDGVVFNGSVHWGWYLGATLLGAIIGAGIGMAISYFSTGSAVSSVGKVWDRLFGKTFYRTMSENDYAYLQETGKLKWSGGNSETFITKSASYTKNKYTGVTVRFKVKKSTITSLEQIGVRNRAFLVAKKYPNMSIVSKGWMKAHAFF